VARARNGRPRPAVPGGAVAGVGARAAEDTGNLTACAERNAGEGLGRECRPLHAVATDDTAERDGGGADRTRRRRSPVGGWGGVVGVGAGLPSTPRTVFHLPSGSEAIWAVRSVTCGHDATLAALCRSGFWA